MKAEVVMSTPIVAVRPTEPIAHAKRMMLRHKIDRLLVMERGKALGMLSMRDIAENLSMSAPAWRRHPIDQIPIGRFMRQRLITVSPTTALDRVAKLMLKHDISSLVVSEDGSPVGIVTKTDLVKYFSKAFKDRFKVAALMTPDPITVNRGHSIARVVEIMKKYKVARVVVAEGRRPIGIITERDVGFAQLEVPWKPPVKMVKYTRRLERAGRPQARYVKHVALLTAEDVMTPNPLTVEMYDDVADAAELMLGRGISGLPVTEREQLVGILTKTDLVKGISRLGS